jgi:hypothetical protein
MAYEILLSVARTARTQSIQVGNDIRLFGGPLGVAIGKVFLVAQPTAPGEADKLYLHVRMAPDTHALALDSVETIRVFTSAGQMVDADVLSATQLK